MSNLINVKNENGKQAVSARELYLGLGLNKSQWSRWYKPNIVENDFFKENVDWIWVRQDVEGNETWDFVITLEFAKHIAMMARTEKSHMYRNYFLECEKKVNQPKQLSPMEQLKLQYEVLDDHDSRLTNLENTMTIDYGQQQDLRILAQSKALEVMNGKDSPVYKDKSTRTKVFSGIWRDFKDYFRVNSYKNTPRKDLDKAISYIENWNPQGKLLREIEELNNQISYKGEF